MSCDDKLESFKAEVYRKTFEACLRMYELDMFLCEISLHEEMRKKTEEERREAYNEIIYRIQDYEDYLFDDTSELNFDDYKSLH